ncbi:piggyBac transposable element-derived protein 4-like [Ischnura elegans]|uniref:piggyBac transposable element-derived protein 4-like n=1 Tax=Ischnura elegans TaxID=197161 RepID=UPI001ED86A3E|nr:piggyBac transposable element-derived protein 4-like [Ischnura elegans]XP_046402047.1 piggyBac transposable element-derived protein 4-like [Ischnura elegans]
MASASTGSCVTDKDLLRLLDESDSDKRSISSQSDLSVVSDRDYAQDEVIPDVFEDEANESASLPTSFSWNRVGNTYRPSKIPFVGQSGPQKLVDNILDSFLQIFDSEVIDLMCSETNRYAQQFIAKSKPTPHSRINNWRDVTREEMYIMLGIFILMGIIQKPSVKSYFTKDPFLETPIFSQMMSLDRFQLISKFLHFVNNDAEGEFTGPKKIFKVYPIVSHLRSKFQTLYVPDENICIDESLTLWKGRLGFKQYIPLKAAKFGIKTFELCESKSGYLWNFFVYTGSGSDIICSTNVDDNLKSSKIVVHLMEPLFSKGYNLWMDNFYNSPYLASLLQKNGVNVAGTLRLSRKNVPLSVKAKTLKKGEVIAYESNGIMVMKWRDKRDVAMISSFHDDGMIERHIRGVNVSKPKCVHEYNLAMGGVDLKDQKLQPYLVERKRGLKWYIKFFKRLLNVSVHNAFVLFRARNTDADHLFFRISLVKALFSANRPQLGTPTLGRPSINPPPRRLVERHFIERIPATGKKAKPQRRCVVCTKHGKRKESIYWCSDCGVGLCFEGCFKTFHTVSDF